ncbi:MAG TPA: LysR family transcriptional regulator [Stellaceae bacterium]|nr:LysR family transcriptional regulator [Stellaceae bacterium]
MDGKKIDLNLLVALDALLAERNVTRAARRLGLSQPALSAQLARLRDLLGDPLLLPMQRGMTPTARAIELAAPVRRALDQVREVLAQGRGFDPATADLSVAIACSDYVQVAVIAPLVLDLRASAPNLRIAIRQLDGGLLGQQMEAGLVDLALMTPSTAPPALRTRTLFRERYVTIARRRHPRVKGKLTLDDFVALDHVVVSPRGAGFRGPVDAALGKLGRERRIAVSAASFLFVPELVARSDLIATVPERLVRGRAERLQALEPPLAVEGFAIGLVWHERTHRHPAHQWLRERLLTLSGE